MLDYPFDFSWEGVLLGCFVGFFIFKFLPWLCPFLVHAFRTFRATRQRREREKNKEKEKEGIRPISGWESKQAGLSLPVPSTYDFNTQAAHSGCCADQLYGSVSPPLFLSTIYKRGDDGSWPSRYVYSRANNPTRELLESTICRLEEGRTAFAFASGMAAAQSIIMSLSSPCHVIIPRDCYGGIATLLKHFHRWGLTHTAVDLTNLEEAEKVLEANPTQVVWCETTSNPGLEVVDIQKLAQITHKTNAFLAVDSTWTTSALVSPLALGADFVLHSCTKFMSGHSDAMAGIVVVGDAAVGRKNNMLIGSWQTSGGGVASPFDCFLILRGLMTLGLRMERSSENAKVVGEWLEKHPKIERVFYPGLKSHPGHYIACGQFKNGQFGGMMSFIVKGGLNSALKVCANTKIFTNATSLGSTESLLEPCAKMKAKCPPGMVRMSVGLESVGDLIADLGQALDSL
jgi:cystathionine gamma-synthase